MLRINCSLLLQLIILLYLFAYTVYDKSHYAIFFKLYCLHCLQLMTLRYLLRLSCLHSLLLIRLNCLQRWTSDITPFVKAKMFASSTRNDNVLFAQAKLFTLLSTYNIMLFAKVNCLTVFNKWHFAICKLSCLCFHQPITLHYLLRINYFHRPQVNDITSSTRKDIALFAQAKLFTASATNDTMLYV